MATQNKSTVSSSHHAPKVHPFGLRTVMELFDVGPTVAITALLAAAAIISASVIYFIHSAPPTMITISSRPDRKRLSIRNSDPVHESP